MKKGLWSSAAVFVMLSAGGIVFVPSSPAGPSEEALAVVTTPDTTGAAIWAHITDGNYQEDWDLWPGMGRLYRGNAPHGALLTTYVNELAGSALEAGEAAMPDGAIVIKENHTPEGRVAAVTVMYKRSGYNPEHNDWFFTKFLADGSLDTMPNGMAMEGRLPGCQGCHIAKRDLDYLYTPRPPVP